MPTLMTFLYLKLEIMNPSHPFVCVVCVHMTIQESLLIPTDMKVFILLDCKNMYKG